MQQLLDDFIGNEGEGSLQSASPQDFDSSSPSPRRIPWNKGKKGVYSEERRKRHSETMKKLFAEGKMVAPFKGKKL